jgi:hypothetical protein
MFVESMTFEEIRAEFEKEKKALMNKVFLHGKQVSKLMRKTNMHTYHKYFEYYSPRKNHWFYKLTTIEENKGQLGFMLYCHFVTKRSYAIIFYDVKTDRLYYHTSHFFTRYFQREGLASERPYDIIKAFAESNTKIITQSLKEISPGVWQLFGQMTQCVGLGYIHHKFNIHEYRTFITNNMLKGTQVELSKQLEEKFKIHIVRNSPGDRPMNSVNSLETT